MQRWRHARRQLGFSIGDQFPVPHRECKLGGGAIRKTGCGRQWRGMGEGERGTAGRSTHQAGRAVSHAEVARDSRPALIETFSANRPLPRNLARGS
jgi:hypothetical protein